jgi:hypothetical protein
MPAQLLHTENRSRLNLPASGHREHSDELYQADIQEFLSTLLERRGPRNDYFSSRIQVNFNSILSKELRAGRSAITDRAPIAGH